MRQEKCYAVYLTRKSTRSKPAHRSVAWLLVVLVCPTTFAPWNFAALRAMTDEGFHIAVSISG